MWKSIMAGFMITLSAAIYLTVGGVLGAFMFSVGLLTILYFQFDLFTGRAGMLAEGGIRPKNLALIWLGNLIGCIICGLLIVTSPLGPPISEPAAAIINIRIVNSWFDNILLGLFCGALMSIAVRAYPKAPYITILSVASFILLGANHCVADMAYMILAANPRLFLLAFAALLFTTIGNIIGCNIITINFTRKDKTR